MSTEPRIETICQCCDRPLTLEEASHARMQVPMVFCRGCFEEYDFITLRQWFKLSMVVQSLRNRPYYPENP